MGVAADAQEVEQALTGPGRRDGLGRDHQPAGRDDAEPDEGGDQQCARRAGDDPPVDGVARDERERQRRQRVERDQPDGDRDQPPHRAQQAAQPEARVGRGRVGAAGLRVVARRGQRRDGGQQLRRGRHVEPERAGRAHADAPAGAPRPVRVAPGRHGRARLVRPQLGGDPADRDHGAPRARRVQPEQLAEERAPPGELGLGAHVDDAPGVQHGDPVGEGEGGAAVRDEHRRPVGRERPQRLVDRGLGGCVDRGRGVVEDEDARVGEHRAGERDALALAARQRHPPLADEGVVAVGQRRDERVHLRRHGGRLDLGVRRVRPAVGDVGADGVGEQERLLEHHAQLPAQVDQPQVGQRDPAQAQLARLGVVEPRQQQPDRGLPRARRPDERERLARRDGQTDAVEHRLAPRVAERDAVQLDRQRPWRQRGRVRRVDDVGLGLDDVVHPLDARPGQLRRHDQRPQQPGRPDQPGDVGGERQERAEADRAGQGHPAAEADHPDLPQRGQREQHRVEPGRHPGRPQALAVQPPGPALQRRDLARLLPEPLDDPDAGDGLLDLLGDVGRALLGRPGGREQRAAVDQRDPHRDRQQDERHDREQRREPEHGRERRHDEHDRPERQRRDLQEPLQQVQVRDRAGHDLARAQRVLALPVEPGDRGEDLPAQVVLDVEGEPAAQVAAQERCDEPHARQREERRDDETEPGRRARDRLVHRGPGQQRADRIQADAEDGGGQGGDRHRAVAHAGADEPADPAGGRRIGRRGGRGVGHGTHGMSQDRQVPPDSRRPAPAGRYVMSRRPPMTAAAATTTAVQPASTPSATHHGGGDVTPARISTACPPASPASARAGRS